MKQTTITILLLLLSFGALKAGEDEEAIKKAIISAYVEAVYNAKDVKNIQDGFHPGFELLGLKEGELTKKTIEDWVADLNEQTGDTSEGTKVRTEAKFPLIDITGNAAVAKVELYKSDTLIYVEYLSLYRFNEGWKIVSKINQKN